MKIASMATKSTIVRFTGLMAIAALIVSNKYPHSHSETKGTEKKGVSRFLTKKKENIILSSHTDEHFFKWSSKNLHPFTPEDTVGATSFRLFDKSKHVETEFQFQNKLMSSRTEGTLDYIIAGFPKCGTSFMMNYMSHDDDIMMLHREQCQFFRGYGTGYEGPKELMEVMETMHNHVLTDRQKLSFKCPNAIIDEAFDEIMSTNYPTTDIIIGIRHPVQHFRSFYNYRMRKVFGNVPVPLAHELIGSNCHHKYMTPVCTDGSKFALPLSKLGKTDLGEAEVDLLASMVYEKDPHYDTKQNAITEYLTHMGRPKMGRVFLYALEQMADEDEGRLNQFVEDLSSFIGLDHTMERPPERGAHPLSGSSSDDGNGDGDGVGDGDGDDDTNQFPSTRGLRKYYAEEEWSDEMREETFSRHKKMMIDICEDVYSDIRELLVKEGALTAKWIREYFLEAEDVVVSQRDHFETILDSFSVDPCVR